MKNRFFYFLVFLTCFLIACKHSDNKPVAIKFSPDSSKILISGIHPAGFYQLKSKLNTDVDYQQLVTVLETPAEDDSTGYERAWSGRLSLMDDVLVFSPDTAFRRGKSYLIETWLNTSFADLEKVWSGRVNKGLRAQQVLLKR